MYDQIDLEAFKTAYPIRYTPYTLETDNVARQGFINFKKYN